jgi:hypothetical protein
MALTADVISVRYGSPDGHQPLNYGIKASTTVYRGQIAILKSGVLIATPDATTNVVVGVVDKAGPGTANSGPGIAGGSTDGAVTAEIQTGAFFFACSTSSDALTVADIGSTVYVYDQVTVAKTDGSSSRPVAGKLVQIDTTQPGGYAVLLGNNQSSGAL